MYGWIWRRLPFGLPGKLIGSALLLLLAAAALWFWAFPAIEPLLPFNDVQVGTDQQPDHAPANPTPGGDHVTPVPSVTH